MNRILLISFFFSLNNSTFFQKTSSQTQSEYCYDLPFEKGQKVFVSQGYGGFFSHKNEFSLDFKLKIGSKVLASRSGTVVKVVDSHDKGGPNKKYLSFGNHIIIKHQDSTYASYWHLKQSSAKVKVGEQVTQGSIIALSGNTGFSTMPHLHFDVYYFDENG